MSLYSALARPALFILDAERAHNLTLAALALPVASPMLRMLGTGVETPGLEQHLFGLSFSNPVGLAAGLDKQGTAARAWGALGFGFAEIGTVTPRPQPGNPLPRLFRLPADTAIINRFGFNSVGADAVAAHLARLGLRRGERATPARIGVNIGKNKDTPNERAADDYVRTVDALHPFADYFVVNVSSPNTAGLRSLQDKSTLRPLIADVVNRVAELSADPAPVLVKVSPDMTDAELLDTVDAALQGGASGIIATNTTISRHGLRTSAPVVNEAGGLSGAPLRAQASHACRVLFRHVGRKVPLIGVGGIVTPDDAYQRVRDGASLVQIYTALIYEGPSLARRLAAGLAERLERDGFAHIGEAVGIDVH